MGLSMLKKNFFKKATRSISSRSSSKSKDQHRKRTTTRRKERACWEYLTVQIQRTPGFGLGIAISGGRDNSHFANGDTSICVSDVLKTGPAEGKLRLNDRIVNANGINFEGIPYARAIEILRECGPTVQLVVKRKILMTSGTQRSNAATTTAGDLQNPNSSVFRMVLSRTGTNKKKKDDFGIVLGCKIYVKEIKSKSLLKSREICEGDTILKINDSNCDGITVKDAKKLMRATSEKIHLLLKRDIINKFNQHQTHPSNLPAIEGAKPYFEKFRPENSYNPNLYVSESHEKIPPRPPPPQGPRVRLLSETLEEKSSNQIFRSPPPPPRSRVPLNISHKNELNIEQQLTEDSDNPLRNIFGSKIRNQQSDLDVIDELGPPPPPPPKPKKGRNHESEENRGLLRQPVEIDENFLENDQFMEHEMHSRLVEEINQMMGVQYSDSNPNFLPNLILEQDQVLDRNFSHELALHPQNQNLQNRVVLSGKRLVSFQRQGPLGIRLIGGNESGIYVAGVQPGTPAHNKGLEIADKILKMNNIDFRGVTREEATLLLLNTHDEINLIVENRVEEFNSVKETQAGDSFYIRVTFNKAGHLNRREMSFEKGDIFHITDTLANGTIGNWLATRLDKDNYEVEEGLIPNRIKAEELATATFKKMVLEMEAKQRDIKFIQKSGRFIKSIFKSISPIKKKKKSSSDNDFLGKNEKEEKNKLPVKLPAYERVYLQPTNFARPLILYGTLEQIARKKLLKDYPSKFALPELYQETKVIRLSGIKEIIKQRKHPILDLPIEKNLKSLRKLKNLNLFPIVIYLRCESQMILKELRKADLRYKPLAQRIIRKKSSKSIGKDFEKWKVWERQNVINPTMLSITSKSSSWFKNLVDLIEREQNKPLWMVHMGREGDGLVESTDLYLSNPVGPVELDLNLNLLPNPPTPNSILNNPMIQIDNKTFHKFIGSYPSPPPPPLDYNTRTTTTISTEPEFINLNTGQEQNRNQVHFTRSPSTQYEQYEIFSNH